MSQQLTEDRDLGSCWQLVRKWSSVQLGNRTGTVDTFREQRRPVWQQEIEYWGDSNEGFRDNRTQHVYKVFSHLISRLAKSRIHLNQSRVDFDEFKSGSCISAVEQTIPVVGGDPGPVWGPLHSTLVTEKRSCICFDLFTCYHDSRAPVRYIEEFLTCFSDGAAGHILSWSRVAVLRCCQPCSGGCELGTWWCHEWHRVRTFLLHSNSTNVAV